MIIALSHVTDVAEAEQPKMEILVMAIRQYFITKKNKQNEKANQKTQPEQKNDFKS